MASLTCTQKALRIARKTDPDALFVIGRSNSANAVVYSLRRSKQDRALLDSKNPVRSYWLVLEKGSAGAENVALTTLEKRLAFGVKVKKIAATSAEFAVAALPKFVVHFVLGGDGVARALVRRENGSPVQLAGVMVHIDPKSPIVNPDIQAVDVDIIDPSLGDEVRKERWSLDYLKQYRPTPRTSEQ